MSTKTNPRIEHTRGIMSLWTRTPMFTLQRGPVIIQTLAANLAAQVFEETEFVTDNRGAELASRFGWPFTRITTSLEPWPADGLTHVWALGKLAACTLQERPFIQFDADVLLFKRLPKRLLGHRVIAQSPDVEHYYASEDMHRARGIAGLPSGHTAYNAGLLGGRDVALVRAYAWAALELAAKFRGCDLNGTTTSMMIEQYHLGVFAARAGVPVGTLLGAKPTRSQVARAGYAHLAGDAKRNPVYVTRAEARLQRDFPEAHAQFVAAWQQMAHPR